MDIAEAPEVLRKFLNYHLTIKGHSQKTVDEYFLDLRTFFRFLKLSHGLVARDTEFDMISIDDVDIKLVRDVTLDDIYAFLAFLSTGRDVPNRKGGSGTKKPPMQASSRARKVACIRSYYKYLTLKDGSLSVNPVADLDSPKVLRALPRYLSLDESEKLLESVDGKNEVRDYCILTIFLNCGLRISELVSLDLNDIKEDRLTVLGKGNKERTVYLNEATAEAINDYLLVRRSIAAIDRNALFLSSRRVRISRSTVNALVKKHLKGAGLDSAKYSSHKLRHTAATLMLHGGVDVRTLQELLGHEHLNTTEIYTHIENEDLKKAAALSPLAAVHHSERPAPAQKGDGTPDSSHDK